MTKKSSKYSNVSKENISFHLLQVDCTNRQRYNGANKPSSHPNSFSLYFKGELFIYPFPGLVGIKVWT